MKYVSIDIETTGLNSKNCDIVEFGAVLDDLDTRQPLNKLPVFHAYFTRDSYVGEPYALSMHKEIFYRIAKKVPGYRYLEPYSFGAVFKQFLIDNGYECTGDKVTINAAGKNFGAFDLPFLNNQSNYDEHIRTRHRILDPGILYYKRGDDKLPDTFTCLKRASIDGEVMHTAVEDAFDVIKLIRAKL